MSKIKIGILGLGVMGKHHLRVLKSLKDCYEVIGIYDTDRKMAQILAIEKGVKAFDSIDALISAVDALVIATPTSTHYEIALKGLASKKHLFIEKPIATTEKEALHLASFAEKQQVKIGVGHIERHNPVVKWLFENVDAKDIVSINIERVGPRPPRIKDVGIIKDLGVHDLDLIAFLGRSPIKEVKCFANVTFGDKEDIAQIITKSENSIVGAINTNWVTPFKSRRIFVATSKELYIADLLRPLVHVYSASSKQIDLGSFSTKEIILRGEEPLLAQARAFHRYCNTQEENSIVDAYQGASVILGAEICLNQSI